MEANKEATAELIKREPTLIDNLTDQMNKSTFTEVTKSLGEIANHLKDILAKLPPSDSQPISTGASPVVSAAAAPSPSPSDSPPPATSPTSPPSASASPPTLTSVRGKLDEFTKGLSQNEKALLREIVKGTNWL